MRSRLLRWGRFLIALAILFFLIKRLYTLLSELEVVAVALQPLWLIVSLTLLLLYFGVLGIPWFFLYRAGNRKTTVIGEISNLASGKGVSFLSIWTFFQLSQLGRYLPGKVGHFVWMLSISHRFGIEKTGAVLATCLQLAFQCCLGCIVGVPILQNTASPLLHNLVASFEVSRKTGLLIGTLGTITLGVGVVFLYKRYLAETLPHLIQQSRAIFLVSGVLRLIGGYLLLWGLLGIAFFLFIKSFYPVSISQLLVVTGSYVVAWSIGFLSIITPSGLGVRESVLSLLLTSVLPPAAAMLVALLSRLWTLSAELVVASVAFVLYWRQRN